MRNFLSRNKPVKESLKDSQNPGKNDTYKDLLVDGRLKESEMRYRRLFETAKDGILILDFETGKIVDANPFIIEIIDYPSKKILGKKLWEIGLFSNKKQSQLAFTELKANNYIRFEDMPLQKKNGEKIDVEFISNVYLTGNTKVIQCNIREITERKKAEKRQELTAKILSILNRQDHWKQLIDDIIVEIKNFTGVEVVSIRLKESEGFLFYKARGFPEYFIQTEKYPCSRNEKDEIICDNKGKPYLECMFGDVVTGRTDPSLPYFTKGGSFYSNNTTELVAATTEKERQSATSNRCNAEGYESVALIPLYSGKEIIGLLQLNDKRPDMFSAEMIEFFEKTGNTIGIAFNRIQNENKIKESDQYLKRQNTEYLDLNEKYTTLNQELIESLNRFQNMNDELISAKLKAEESDNLKSAFLANMSHEIRTPMNAIMGFSGFLSEPGLSKEKLDDYVQIINASSLQLLTVIGDVIDISKIETDQIIIDLESVNINNLLNELFVIYEKLVAIKNLSLYCSCDRPNDLIQIRTDRNRIKQIICNLLNNAIKFTKEGEIEFGYQIKTNFIEFYVKDTGIGIAPENHELIFQRFRQVESSDTSMYSGNGLGLSISKALAEKLGGTITINSEVGIGSRFVFTIPYIKGIENKVTTLLTTEPDLYNWNEKTILLVEDEVNNHAYIKELLSVTNVKMLHAWDGKEAVEHVQNHSDISLVLMDIKIPIMDGYKATRLIKQINPKLPVIAQTAYAISYDREQALKAGCDNYIPKPIDRSLLMEVINSYLS